MTYFILLIASYLYILKRFPARSKEWRAPKSSVQELSIIAALFAILPKLHDETHSQWFRIYLRLTDTTLHVIVSNSPLQIHMHLNISPRGSSNISRPWLMCRITSRTKGRKWLDSIWLAVRCFIKLACLGVLRPAVSLVTWKDWMYSNCKAYHFDSISNTGPIQQNQVGMTQKKPQWRYGWL
ncbi:hypothetical protein ASPWEDRAFT_705529 [Aspergillus wentii DTO 134E9]|uniref:Uncharacterized protein n=1 Tax=Aspergillus wentii DTO 134E9 TaxID=1073089 RepID=A0A1L9R5V5_ASPWE|nr:uncharacterized protein ASPWEDRAFT_705529 [Aspergillus wentii DTO 134E9]OJJ30305.1 hypothetical protein ASPWEDRAFT_705529 [Aspergillus wentii DTO 134E9]